MLACLACTVKESSCKLTFHVASFVYLFRKLLNGCFVCLSLQAETIRRAKPIVGEELVDIEYRVFEGLEMVPAENVVDTMNRLSEAEFVVTLNYAVGVTHLLAFLFNGNLRFLWVLILSSVSVVCVFLFVFFPCLTGIIFFSDIGWGRNVHRKILLRFLIAVASE